MIRLGWYISGHSAKKFVLNSRTVLTSASLAVRGDDTRRETLAVRSNADAFIHNIKCAESTNGLLELVAQSHRDIKQDHVMTILRSIFGLQKSDRTSMPTSDIMRHPELEKICRALKSSARHLEINDVIEALKILFYVGVPPNSEIATSMLNVIRYNINDITLNHIAFLDFLLRKCERTPLIEALLIALPILFEIQLSSKLDHENIPQLVDLLLFISRNKINDKCTMAVVSALTLHGLNYNGEVARSILWSLYDLKHFKSAYAKLLANASLAFQAGMEDLSLETIEMMLEKICTKVVQRREIFYNESLINAIVKEIIRRDTPFTESIFIIKKLNRMTYTNTSILDHVINHAKRDPKLLTEARPTVLLTFVAALAQSEYIPVHWTAELKSAILDNSIFKQFHVKLPWAKFALELMVIDCLTEPVVDHLFSKEFLSEYLNRENNTLDYLQLLLLYQAVSILYPHFKGPLISKQFLDKAIDINMRYERTDFPIRGILDQLFGASCVMTKLSTTYGHFIDHLIGFNKAGEPVSLSAEEQTDGVKSAEELLRKHPDIIQPVAVLVYPQSHFVTNSSNLLRGAFNLRIKTLEALGYYPVVISQLHWYELPEIEKVYYLEREIKSKVKQVDSS